MSCQACTDLRLEARIRSPKDLQRCIHSAAEALRAGLLKDAGHGQFGDPFAKIADGKGWGDFVDNYFSCAACSQPFRLHAETYHGSGGAFERCSQRDIAA